MSKTRQYLLLLLVSVFSFLVTRSSLSAQTTEFAPINADNIGEIQQITTIPRITSGHNLLKIYDETGHVLIRTEDNFELWNVITGELQESKSRDAYRLDNRHYGGDSSIFPETFDPNLPFFEQVQARADLLLSAPVVGAPYDLATWYEFSPDEQHLVMWSTTIWGDDPSARGTMLQFVSVADGTVTEIEIPYMIYDITWSPNGTHFLGFAEAVWPGQIPVVFTADGELVTELAYEFPAEDDAIGIEEAFWVDNERIITMGGYLYGIHEVYTWDARSGEQLTVLMPYGGERYGFEMASGNDRFKVNENDTILILDAAGEIISSFPQTESGSYELVAGNTVFLQSGYSDVPLQLWDMDGQLLSTSEILSMSSMYEYPKRDFNADRTLLVDLMGATCTAEDSQFYLWDMSDVSEPLATMSYFGFLKIVHFIGDETMIAATVAGGLPDPWSSNCEFYKDAENAVIFWNLNGERIYEIKGLVEVSFMLDNTVMLLDFRDHIEVWGIPPS